MRNTTMMEKLAAVFPVKKEGSEVLLAPITLPVPAEENIPPLPESPTTAAPPVKKAKSPTPKAKKKKANPAKKSSAKAKKVTTSTKKPAASTSTKKTEVPLPKPAISPEKTADTVPVVPTVVSTKGSLGPRYVTNPKLSHPFSVHVYPVLELEKNGDPYAKEPETPVLPPETKQSVTEAVSEEVEDTQTKEPVVLQNAPSVVETSQPEPALQIIEKPKEESTMIATQAVIVSPESAEKISLVPQPKPDLPVEIKDPAEPAAVVPPLSNLEWLTKPTPFKDHLKGMVDKLRDAKTNIAFTLEQLRARQKKLEGEQKKLEDELYQVQFSIEQQKDNLRQLDDTISACALVAEQSATIPSGLLTSVTAHKIHAKTEDHSNEKPRYRSPDDPTACHQRDIVEFFATHPNSDWQIPKILEELPEIKKEHAKRYLNVLLPAMVKTGKIQRVSIGVYRSLES